MNLNQYQELANRTNPTERTLHAEGEDRMLLNAALGLAGEAGEFADIIKKFIFHHKQLSIHEAMLELGDVLWYVSQGATALGYTLEEVAEMNIEKLKERHPHGVNWSNK